MTLTTILFSELLELFRIRANDCELKFEATPNKYAMQNSGLPISGTLYGRNTLRANDPFIFIRLHRNHSKVSIVTQSSWSYNKTISLPLAGFDSKIFDYHILPLIIAHLK
jgi:hypothetical protein